MKNAIVREKQQGATALVVANGRDSLLGGVVEVVGGDDRKPALLQKLLANANVGT